MKAEIIVDLNKELILGKEVGSIEPIGSTGYDKEVLNKTKELIKVNKELLEILLNGYYNSSKLNNSLYGSLSSCKDINSTIENAIEDIKQIIEEGYEEVKREIKEE